ncbi:hypothetical protein EVAR_27670_1 [Eumeta japonica]|uniref:Pre-C2HC domain-containing protein n=1 Tax=Eumeta variegata TaxID=151549 RepID=A0A4C1V1P7_EUMVA|nr:hypothetical protein EVAR_27670_1 [Eumeta japonica]
MDSRRPCSKRDGQTKVVDVRTSGGVLRRPATRVIALQTNEEVFAVRALAGGGMLPVDNCPPVQISISKHGKSCPWYGYGRGYRVVTKETPPGELKILFQIVKKKSKRVTWRLCKSSGRQSYTPSWKSIKGRCKSKWNLIASECKSIPVDIATEDIKNNIDIERQEYPVQAVHRIHRRDGTALGLVLVILKKTDGATDIFKKLASVCGLSEINVEAPYKRGILGQRHCCQLYSHDVTNCHAPPRCVKCLDSYWTRGARESGGKPVSWSISLPNRQSILRRRKQPEEKTSSQPPPQANQWKNLLPWVNTKQTKGTNIKDSQNQTSRQAGTAASALGDDIGTIMSILQAVRSAEVADLAAKFKKAKHGVYRLKIILEIRK